MKILTSLLLVCCLVSCAGGYHVRAGAPNVQASVAYDTLLATDQIIQSAKLEFKDGTLPESAKPLLNNLIKFYDIARVALNDYDAAVRINRSDVASYLKALTGALSDVNAAVTSYKVGGQ